MKRAALGLCLCAASLSASAAEMFTIAPELWDRPRSAHTVLNLPAVRQAVDQLLARPAARLVIHHGSGQEPLIQAEELRMWLMALAIDGARVSVINDVRPREPLKIEIK